MVNWSITDEVVGGVLTDDCDEDTRIYDSRHAATTRCNTDHEANDDHGHEEEDEWGSLRLTVREPCCRNSDDGCGDVDRDLDQSIRAEVIQNGIVWTHGQQLCG